MIIYVIVFLISSFLIFLSEKSKKNKLVSYLLLTIALLLPCLLAGLRNEEIGTDIRVYVKKLYLNADYLDSFKVFLSSGWNLSWRFKSVSEFEIGFNFFIYVITKLFSNLQAVLFFIQLLIILPVYIGIKEILGDYNKVWLGMLIYYFMFFCQGLNLMRQMIGISICFYATACLFKRPKFDFHFFILIIIATLFHQTSILAIIIYAFYKLVSVQSRKNFQFVYSNHRVDVMKVLVVLFALVGIIVIFNSDFLRLLLDFMNFNYYLGYISGEVIFSYRQLLIRIPIIIFFLFYFKKSVLKNKKMYLFLILMLLDVLISNLSSASIYASRICLIFQFFYIVSLPMLLDNEKKSCFFRKFYLIGYSVCYWYIMYYIYGVGQVIPYQFFW